MEPDVKLRHGSLLGFVLAVAACSQPAVRATKLADGTHELRCQYELWRCLLEVDDYCKGRSYEVVSGGDEQIVFGSPDTSVEGHRSFAVVRCLRPGEKPGQGATTPAPSPEVGAPSAAATVNALPVVTSAAPVQVAPVAAAPQPAPRASAPLPERHCVPGATQACVGPAGCSGGQACLADASGFGACDCGPVAAPR
jgi:hypothetical protein